MPQKRKYRLAIILIVVALAGIWGGIAAASLEPRLGLDLQGGISVVLSPREGGNTESLEQAVNIIRNRVDALGVAEPEIARQGETILVQLPGIKDQQRALDLIGTTAQLRFRPVLEAIFPGQEGYEEAGPPDCSQPTVGVEDTPGGEVVFCAKDEAGEVGPNSAKLRLGPVRLEGADLARAQAELDPSGVQGWSIAFDLTGDGSRKFAEVTGQLACNQGVGRELAITLDKVVESHPPMGSEIQCGEGITGGSAQITGNFSESEAKNIALVLRYGALPVELEASATTTVSPTLGKESLKSGLIAGAIGLVALLLYVLVFYRALGLVIWVGLIVHGGITIGIVILLGELAGFALTLAGIAGLIVSLGVATDSFIVYFERIKDEVSSGKTVRVAVDRAWASAKRTIVAADLVTALAAIVLYLLAVGGVRGFALMLGLATALDLVVSFFFMHPLVWLIAQTKALSDSKTLGVHASTEPAPVGGGSR